MATFRAVGPTTITIPGVLDKDGKPRVFTGDIWDVTVSMPLPPPESPKEEEPPTEDEADGGTERDGA